MFLVNLNVNSFWIARSEETYRFRDERDLRSSDEVLRISLGNDILMLELTFHLKLSEEDRRDSARLSQYLGSSKLNMGTFKM